MKSKTSFFNKTVLKKNFTLFWPVWGLYLLIELLLGPVRLLIDFQKEHQMYHESMGLEGLMKKKELVVFHGCNLEIMVVVLFFFAGIIGMMLFRYLMNAKSANMMHAFPVTRGELFRTNILSGLLMLWIPQILHTLCGSLVCLVYGVTDLRILFLFMAAKMVISFICFSMITLCVMLTGQGGFSFVLMFVFNRLYSATVGMISLFVSLFSKGVPFNGDGKFGEKLAFLSPLDYMGAKVEISYNSHKNPVLMGSSVLLGYTVMAVVFFGLAFLLYRKRQIEDAGKLISVRPLRPVFRWSVGFFVGGYLTLIFMGITSLMGFSYPTFLGALLFACACSGVFFLAQMLLRKQFKIFEKNFLLESAGYFVCMIIIMVLFHGRAMKVQNFVPEKSDVEFVYLNTGKTCKIGQDEMDLVLSMHRSIVEYMKENRDEISTKTEELLYEIGEDTDVTEERIDTLEFSYFTKSGEFVNRSYTGIPKAAFEDELLEEIIAYQNEPKNYFKLMFTNRMEDASSYQIEQVDARVARYDDNGEEYQADLQPQDSSKTEEFLEKLKKAIEEDMKEQTIQKYNSSITLSDQKESKELYYLEFQWLLDTENEAYKKEQKFLDKHQEELLSMEWFYSYYDCWQDWAGINIGEDCRNCRKVLKDYGILEQWKKTE